MAAGNWYEIVLPTSVVTGDGTVNFGIDTLSTNGHVWASRHTSDATQADRHRHRLVIPVDRTAEAGGTPPAGVTAGGGQSEPDTVAGRPISSRGSRRR